MTQWHTAISHQIVLTDINIGTYLRSSSITVEMCKVYLYTDVGLMGRWQGTLLFSFLFKYL